MSKKFPRIRFLVTQLNALRQKIRQIAFGPDETAAMMLVHDNYTEAVRRLLIEALKCEENKLANRKTMR